MAVLDEPEDDGGWLDEQFVNDLISVGAPEWLIAEARRKASTPASQ